jgi:hypothetical protein
MEIVLVIAAVLGLALLIVPRVRRRGAARVRRNAGKQWTATAASRRRRRSPALAMAVGSATVAPPDAEEEWDDDLSWDGLGTTGKGTPLVERAPPPWATNGATAPPVAEPAEDEEAGAAEEPEFRRGAEFEPAQPAPEGPPLADRAPLAPEPDPPFADRTPLAPEPDPLADRAPLAPEPDPVADRAPLAPEPAPPFADPDPDWDWEPEPAPLPPEPALARAPAAPRAAPDAAKRRRVNPLVLVGLYAAFGIGLIVLAVSLITGAMSGTETRPAPKAAATAVPSASPTPPAASAPGSGEQEAERLRQAFIDQRRAVLAGQARAIREARAEARRAVRRARARARARRRAVTAPRNAAPAPARPARPAPFSGGGGGGGGCEFCIG